MELADSVLDDDYPDMAVNGVWDNMEAVDRNARALLKELDTEDNYCALWKYSAERGNRLFLAVSLTSEKLR